MRQISCMSLLAAALLVGACASMPSASDSSRLAMYRAHAGGPVASFRMSGSLNNWTALGERALAVWTRPNEAWLLELAAPCSDLDVATAIRLTDNMGRVSARFDKVLPLEISGAPRTTQPPCVIQSIRPLDVEAIRAAERDARQAPDQPSGT